MGFFLFIKLLDNLKYCLENVKFDLSRNNFSCKVILVFREYFEVN